jgi:hypothetical protein
MIKIDKDIPTPNAYDRYHPYYRRDCINTLKSLDIGDSILIKDRTHETANLYVRVAERKTNLKFTVKSINHWEHRIWRIGNDVNNKLCKTKKCSRCKMDINKDKNSGGCYCYKHKHINPRGLVTTLWECPSGSRYKISQYNINKNLDYIDEFYDGYGIYDAIRRNIDNEEFLNDK